VEERAGRWLSTIPRLVEHPLRVSFARAELYTLRVADAALALNEVCLLAEQSGGEARQVLGAFVPLIADLEHLERCGMLRAAALSASLLGAGRLLRASTPEGHLLDPSQGSGGAKSTVLQSADGRPLTLGERRALARQPMRKTLDKLLRDPHPLVVRILLGNPRVTEDDVVRMAAFRPASPPIVGEIAKAWSRSARVRMAIVLNPGAPPAVAVPVLALLARHELAQVVRATDVAAITRATAHDHFGLRLPLPHEEPPGLVH
jgi:hypothetical protein